MERVADALLYVRFKFVGLESAAGDVGSTQVYAGSDTGTCRRSTSAGSPACGHGTSAATRVHCAGLPVILWEGVDGAERNGSGARVLRALPRCGAPGDRAV